MVAIPHVPRWSVERYLELERFSTVKHEYIDGYVYAMAGGTRAHSAIGANVVALLATGLRGGPCTVYDSDMKVYVTATVYVYPDASVSCDPRDTGVDDLDWISIPRLAVEVLSDSTREYDTGDKFDLYRQNAALEEYVLVETRRQLVEVRARQQDGSWATRLYTAGDTVALTSVSSNLPMGLIYDKTRIGP